MGAFVIIRHQFRRAIGCAIIRGGMQSINSDGPTTCVQLQPRLQIQANHSEISWRLSQRNIAGPTGTQDIHLHDTPPSNNFVRTSTAMYSKSTMKYKSYKQNAASINLHVYLLLNVPYIYACRQISLSTLRIQSSRQSLQPILAKKYNRPGGLCNLSWQTMSNYGPCC